MSRSGAMAHAAPSTITGRQTGFGAEDDPTATAVIACEKRDGMRSVAGLWLTSGCATAMTSPAGQRGAFYSAPPRAGGVVFGGHSI